MLYHIDVYWPKCFDKKIILDAHELYWSYHAKDRMRQRGIVIPNECSWDIIECETDLLQGSDKLTLRTRVSIRTDLVIVVKNNKLITLWVNDSLDRHTTLDKSPYVVAP